MKRLLPLLLLLTACSTPQPALSVPPPPPTSTTPPPSPDLMVTVGAADAAMGLRVQALELTNNGTTPHVINGYPTITLFDKTQQPVTDVQVIQGSGGISTINGFDDKPQQITLKPGEKLIASLLWRNTVTRSDINATNAEYLDVVSTPGQPTQRLHPQYPVDLGNTGKLGVSPWALQRG